MMQGAFSVVCGPVASYVKLFKAYFNEKNLQKCPGLNANEIQIFYDRASESVLISIRAPKHTHNFVKYGMNMSNNLAKYMKY